MTMMTRYDPFGNMLPLRQAMSQLMEDSFVAPFARPAQATNIMPVDVYETRDAFVVKAFMPGLSADDLTINVEERTVTIHGEPKAEQLDGLRPVLRERPMGAFTRSFALPVPLDPANVQAELVNGVLSLTLPKSAAAKPHKIQVKES